MTTFTPGEIDTAIVEIMRAAKDDEKAHALEDALYEKFIHYIANEAVVPKHIRRKARQVLLTKDLGFDRLCA